MKRSRTHCCSLGKVFDPESLCIVFADPSCSVADLGQPSANHAYRAASLVPLKSESILVINANLVRAAQLPGVAASAEARHAVPIGFYQDV